MPRLMVGLLAAAGAVMAALVGLTHGDLVPVVIVGSATATGLAAYLPSPHFKKTCLVAIRREDRRYGLGAN